MPALEHSLFPCASPQPHSGLEEQQVGPVQREQMGPGHRESCLAAGMEQGAPTAYSSLGKVPGQEGGALTVKTRK